ncbi:Protein LURP-one-related 14 [Linum perenne]
MEYAYGVPQVSVVGDGYCFPYCKELVVKKTIKGLSNAQFEVFDPCGNLLLRVEGGVWNLRMKRVFRDPSGFPLLTLYGKSITFWHKWSAYANDDIPADQGMITNDNLLFTVKQSHPLQIKKDLNVYLSTDHHQLNPNNNINSIINPDSIIKKTGLVDAPDFNVTGSYTSLSFKVYKGHRILAEVKHNFTLESFYKGKERFTIKVYPEVDYAFIIALLVIIDENDTP